MPLYQRLNVGVRSDGRANRRYVAAVESTLLDSLVMEHGYSYNEEGHLVRPTRREACPCGCGERFIRGSDQWLEGERALRQRLEREARQASPRRARITRARNTGDPELERLLREEERIEQALRDRPLIQAPSAWFDGPAEGPMPSNEEEPDTVLAEVFAAAPLRGPAPSPMSERVRQILDQPVSPRRRRPSRVAEDVASPETASVTVRPRYIHRDRPLP